MSQRLILIRGLPGSGKTTLARSFAAVHIEADMYFIDHKGEYRFDANRLKDAHQWCFQTAVASLLEGHSIVVSNTFIQYWEMKPYIEFATKKQIAIDVICCVGEFENIHGVNDDTRDKMRKKWQKCQWLKQNVHQPLR
ncbi:AAA family ATPase [Vibrio sp. RC27]